jgi:phage recombination protein Bet
MMSLPTARPPAGIPALQMSEDERCAVLQDSIYPGAKLDSIKMVISVCKASGKDPLKKPYHIVPMSVSTGEKGPDGWDVKAMRDVIMPGINDYRTDAARTGQHAGTSEPEFGPDVTQKFGDVEITYPRWCRVTVRRQMASGQVVEFSAVELWLENYATKGARNAEPNAMWKKRPYAQLAKCAEAQALRKGFPEVGSQSTAEEMEGKEIEMGHAEVVRAPAASLPPALPQYSDEQFDTNLPKWADLILAGKKTAHQIVDMVSSKAVLSEAQISEILSLQPASEVDA